MFLTTRCSWTSNPAMATRSRSPTVNRLVRWVSKAGVKASIFWEILCYEAAMLCLILKIRKWLWRRLITPHRRLPSMRSAVAFPLPVKRPPTRLLPLRQDFLLFSSSIHPCPTLHQAPPVLQNRRVHHPQSRVPSRVANHRVLLPVLPPLVRTPLLDLLLLCQAL